VAAALLLAVGGSACDSLLEVDDPVNLTPDDLAGEAPVDLTINGVRGAFQEMMDNYVLHTGLLTDEFVLAGTFPYRQEIDERSVPTNNQGLLGELYTPLSVARFMADTGVVVLQEALDAGGDPGPLADGIALGKFLGGFTRVLLAESMCVSPIAGGPALSSDDRMRDALAVLVEAVSAAEAAGDTDMVAAARVAQARAHLWLREFSEAAAVAAQVPAGFEFEANYSNNTVNQFNRVANVTHALDDVTRWTVGDGTIAAVGNEKWAYFDEWVALGLLEPRPDLESFNPLIPVVHQMKYTTGDANIVVASWGEAQLAVAEHKLRTNDAAGSAAILNGLREKWGLEPLTMSGTLSADLGVLARERARELYLSGERMGTLRRLLVDGVDLFPPNKSGSDTCFPLPERETDTNPNT
jgi:hypothetical protein